MVVRYVSALPRKRRHGDGIQGRYLLTITTKVKR